jgi:hypothetical protein
VCLIGIAIVYCHDASARDAFWQRTVHAAPATISIRETVTLIEDCSGADTRWAACAYRERDFCTVWIGAWLTPAQKSCVARHEALMHCFGIDHPSARAHEQVDCGDGTTLDFQPAPGAS